MSAIAIIDSGVGGLTILRAIQELLPQEKIIYFGDTARVPYGGKSRDTIIQYARQISQFLLSHKIKMLVLGCHTASAFASDILSRELSIPVINVIDPLVEEVASQEFKHVAVLGTAATIRSEVYHQRFIKRLPHVKVTGIACPLFVPLVEEQFQNHPAARLVVEEYLIPLKTAQVDLVVLGCTHYPILYPQIRGVLGEEVKIVDGALACAKQIKTSLICNSFNKSLLDNEKLKYFVSDDPEKFKRLGEQFLGTQIGPIEQVQIRKKGILQFPQRNRFYEHAVQKKFWIHCATDRVSL